MSGPASSASSSDGLPLLPPLPATLLDTPWIKVNSRFYEDRWTRLRQAKKSSRPITHIVTKNKGDADLILHVVRHGEGIHNLAADTSIARGTTALDQMPYRFGLEGLNPQFIDSPLTAKGIAEAIETGEKECRHVSPQPKYLVVSPLQRATQTGLLCWSHLLPEDGSSPRLPVIATDLCRESYHSRNICDLRRPISSAISQFPFIDYSDVDDTRAPTTSVSHVGAIPIIEDIDSVVDRAYDFLSWLAKREGLGGESGGRGKEGSVDAIAVASHSVFILALTQGVFHYEDENDDRKGYFKTGEMRTFPIKFVYNEDTRGGATTLPRTPVDLHRSLGNKVSSSRLVVKELVENGSSTYLVYDSFTLSGVIVNPVDVTAERDLQIARSMRVRLFLGLNTHAHADHVAGMAKVRLALSTSDEIFASAISAASGVEADKLLKDGDRIYLGERYMTAISTPGRTDEGCMSFVADDESFVLKGGGAH